MMLAAIIVVLALVASLMSEEEWTPLTMYNLDRILTDPALDTATHSPAWHTPLTLTHSGPSWLKILSQWLKTPQFPFGEDALSIPSPERADPEFDCEFEGLEPGVSGTIIVPRVCLRTPRGGYTIELSRSSGRLSAEEIEAKAVILGIAAIASRYGLDFDAACRRRETLVY